MLSENCPTVKTLLQIYYVLNSVELGNESLKEVSNYKNNETPLREIAIKLPINALQGLICRVLAGVCNCKYSIGYEHSDGRVSGVRYFLVMPMPSLPPRLVTKTLRDRSYS